MKLLRQPKFKAYCSIADMNTPASPVIIEHKCFSSCFLSKVSLDLSRIIRETIVADERKGEGMEKKGEAEGREVQLR